LTVTSPRDSLWTLSKGSGGRRRLVLAAAAKVNLALEILGKRGDGYHEIATVMQAVDLSDRLELEVTDGLELRTVTPEIPPDDTNLALRAARALREAAAIDRGVRITLDKRIPVAAGLGGGSTDAAAVLVGLNRLWGLRWPLSRLDEVAIGLGMDVPFFLRGGGALATGRGEKVEPVAGGALALVVVNPRMPLSTAGVYARVTPGMYTDGARVRTLVSELRSRRPARIGAALYNGLEPAAQAALPQVSQMRAALDAAGALGTVMSGSGPTVFGVARSLDHARQIRRRVARAPWSCWAVRTLSGPAIRVRATAASAGLR